MGIARDEKTPEITVIKTPQGDIRFNFNVSKGTEIASGMKLGPFSEEGRAEVEKALDEALNPVNSPAKVQELQGKFNSTIIATQRGFPLSVATCDELTAKDTGGAALGISKATGEAVLGLNLDEVAKTPYEAGVAPPPMTRPIDQIRHELFHYVDPYLSESNKIDPQIREKRALWSVNQIMIADNQLPRLAYGVPQTDKVESKGFYSGRDSRLEGMNIPHHKLFGEPSPNDHRMYPHNMQSTNNAGYNLGLTTPDKDAMLKFETDTKIRQEIRAAAGVTREMREADPQAAQQYVMQEMQANAIRARYLMNHPNVAQNGTSFAPAHSAREPDFSR